MGLKRRFIFLISINKCNNWDAIRNHEFFLFLKRKCKVTGFYHFSSVDLLSEMDDEVLLIDLRSPDKNMQINFQHLTENSCNSQATR